MNKKLSNIKVDYIEIFIVFVLGSVIVYNLINFFYNGTFLRNYITHHDFYVIMNELKNNMYPGPGTCYPPFIIMIFDFMRKLAGNSDTKVMYDAIYNIYVFILIFLLIYVIDDKFNMLSRCKRALLILCVVFGYPFYIAYFHGNFVLFTSICLIVFSLYYDDKKASLLASVFLAMACNMKWYPGIFAICFFDKNKQKVMNGGGACPKSSYKC